MKLILVVEYLVNGNIIRASDKISVEEAIMMENASCFSLAYSSPTFEQNIIEIIGELDQTEEVKNLIFNDVMLLTENKEINHFLALLYQPNYSLISEYITCERWNRY